MYKRSYFLVSAVVLLLLCGNVYADSTAQLIEQGNKSWLAGDYKDAITKYDEASVNDPESPYIYFNKGTAFYKKGDYTAAIKAFEKAALRSKEPLLESKCWFNLGNSNFREAQKHMDSDIKKSLVLCQKSIRNFQDALKLDPKLKKAAENIEVVRLIMKNILDKIKKQEEEAKKREQAAKKNAENIRELIKRQEAALEKTREFNRSKLKYAEKKHKLNELADEQKKITRDTRKLAEKVKGQSPNSSKNREIPAVTHLNNAVKDQIAAEGNLRNSAPLNAEKNQKNAVEELKAALSPPGQGRNGQGQNQNQKGQQGQKKQQPMENKPSRGYRQPQNQNQASIRKQDETAQDILNEERERENIEHRRMRRMRSSGGYSNVDKDW